jgi:hypothetical protein
MSEYLGHASTLSIIGSLVPSSFHNKGGTHETRVEEQASSLVVNAA